MTRHRHGVIRRQWGACALLVALLGATAPAAPALAVDNNEPRASDGRRLADESIATQASFFITFGVQAPAQWAQEHTAELVVGHGTPTTTVPNEAGGTNVLPDGAIVTPIAFQAFVHGFMLWRKDNDQFSIGYADVHTKTGSPCQETYRDTYRGQTFDIAAPPAGLSVPKLGFGWLYANDPQLASHLGYATGDEVSRVAEIRSRTTDTGGQSLELRLSEPIKGELNPLVIAHSDEPGLTYCFPRGNENRSNLNTWVALQRFQYGLMTWRQDNPDRIEVVHFDTDLAPEFGCVDIFRDSWMPGEALDYGDLAVAGRRLPERGFGKIWLSVPYVRRSLGNTVAAETGGFAEISFERYNHPRRGPILIRHTQVTLPSGEPFKNNTYFPGGGDPQREDQLSMRCGSILIPHTS